MRNDLDTKGKLLNYARDNIEAEKSVFDLLRDLLDKAYILGNKDGYAEGYEEGYGSGETNGYDAGYDQGYADGAEECSAERL